MTPSFSWYGLLVVALVALDGRWEWLAVPAAGQVLHPVGGEDAQRVAYGGRPGPCARGAGVAPSHDCRAGPPDP
ncbi:hypothetical protein ACWC9T_19650 [Kitasatospora sp. NPDC001159]